MRYIVTKEIKSDTQVVWKLYFKDFAFLVIWIIVNLYLQDGVHPYLQIPFCVFAILSGVILVMPSATNPKRRQYQSIALYLMRPKGTYYLIRQEEQHVEERHDKKHRKRYTNSKLR